MRENAFKKYVPIRPAPEFETRIGTQKFTNILPCETQSDLFSALNDYDRKRIGLNGRK